MRPDAGSRLLVAGGTAGLALLAGYLAGWLVSGGLRQAAAFPALAGHEHQLSLQLSPAAQRVATGLKCACGCPDLLLACDCQNLQGAAEIKRYILELLANGRSEPDARIELINRYGAKIERVGR
jgi:hypothetical protein